MEGPAGSQRSAIELSRNKDTRRRAKKRKINYPLEEAVIALQDFTNLVRRENEFDIFGKSVAVQLNRLPIGLAIELQQEIQCMITEKRLHYLRRRRYEPPVSSDCD